MSVKLGVVSGAAGLGLSRIISNLVALLSLAVVARLLSPADYGLAAIALTLFYFVNAMTDLSVTAALVQRQDVTPAHVDTAWTLALIRALLIAAGFAAAAWPLADVYDDQRLVPVFIAIGLTGAFTGLASPAMAVHFKALRFGSQVALDLVSKATILVTSVAVALWLRNYWAIIIGNAAGAAAAMVLSYVLAPYRPRISLSRWQDLLGFSGWSFLTQLVKAINWRLDQLLSGFALTRAQLGAYAVADSLAALPTRETAMPLTQALFPGLAGIAADRHRLRRAFLTAQSSITMIALPCAVGFALVAQPVVRMAIGERWLGIVPLVQFIACCYAVQTLTFGVAPLAAALGRMRLLFIGDAVGLALRAPCLAAGLLMWGLDGLLWGRALTAGFDLCIALTLVRRMTGVGQVEQIASHWRTLTALAAMLAVIVTADSLLGPLVQHPLSNLAVLAVLGAATYPACLFLLWLINGRQDCAETELWQIARRLLDRRATPAMATPKGPLPNPNV